MCCIQAHRKSKYHFIYEKFGEFETRALNRLFIKNNVIAKYTNSLAFLKNEQTLQEI